MKKLLVLAGLGGLVYWLAKDRLGGEPVDQPAETGEYQQLLHESRSLRWGRDGGEP